MWTLNFIQFQCQLSQGTWSCLQHSFFFRILTTLNWKRKGLITLSWNVKRGTKPDAATLLPSQTEMLLKHSLNRKKYKVLWEGPTNNIERLPDWWKFCCKCRSGRSSACPPPRAAWKFEFAKKKPPSNDWCTSHTAPCWSPWQSDRLLWPVWSPRSPPLLPPRARTLRVQQSLISLTPAKEGT